MYINFISR